MVERTISWFHQFRRLRVRFEPRDDIHQGLCKVAETLITDRFLVLYGLVEGTRISGVVLAVLKKKSCRLPALGVL